MQQAYVVLDEVADRIVVVVAVVVVVVEGVMVVEMDMDDIVNSLLDVVVDELSSNLDHFDFHLEVDDVSFLLRRLHSHLPIADKFQVHRNVMSVVLWST
jgi:hypothetical protein